MINKEKVHINLNQKLPVIVFNSTDSTNTQARRILSSKHSERMLIVANEQTNGRGRLGRSFYSPADTGIYMTYSFYTEKTCNNIARITTAASVAVAKALNCDAKIKWVNDLYCNDRKICGILTESFSSAMGKGLYVLVGIGVNLTTESFPDDIKMIADKALLAREAREKAKKAKEAVRNASEKKSKALKFDSKLADCYSKDRSKCEIYITEGKR